MASLPISRAHSGQIHAVKPITVATIVVILAAFISYFGTLQFDFISDDHSVIEHNQYLQHWSNLKIFITGNIWAFAGTASYYYRPVFAFLWFMLFQIFGTKAWGWHLASVLLHTCSTVLCLNLARKLLRNDQAAVMAALLFALHPVHVEAVSWVSASNDPLMTLFGLSAILCYIQAREQASGFWRIGSLIFYMLAMLTKEPGITVIGMVAGYEWFCSPNLESNGTVSARMRKLWQLFWPWILAAVMYLWIRRIVLGGITTRLADIPFTQVIQTWPWLLWFYIKKLVMPLESSLYYDSPYVDDFTFDTFWMPLAGTLICGIALLIWYYRSRDGRIPCFIIFTVMPILPQWDLRVFFPHEFAHDRYLYFSSVGFCLLMGLAWEQILARWKTATVRTWKPLVCSAALVMAVFLPITISESSYWANDLLLFSHSAKMVHRYTTLLYTGLGNVLMRRGMPQEALIYYREVARQRPNMWIPNMNLGEAFYTLQKYPEAEIAYATAASIADPNHYESLLKLGLTRMRMGQAGYAEPVFREAVEIVRGRPGSERFEVELAACLAAQSTQDPIKREEAFSILHALQEKSPHDEIVLSILHQLELLQVPQKK